MLHTGTMFAVIVYFWRSWRATYFRSVVAFKAFFWAVVLATLLTGLVGEGMYIVVEHTLLADVPHAQIEDLFGHLEVIAPALAAMGVLILIAGILERRGRTSSLGGTRIASDATGVSARQAGIIGAVQGLSLPFRGFSRSGATISTGLLIGVAKARAEIFSFALAVVLTPPVVAREALRLLHTAGVSHQELESIAARDLVRGAGGLPGGPAGAALAEAAGSSAVSGTCLVSIV